MIFHTVLNRYLPYLEDCRHRIVADLEKTPGTAVLAGYFQGGKMFRALLTFVAADAIGVELIAMVPVASALEVMHGASLIHDDIVDEANKRRGRPALHVQMGTGPALILGDYLILRAFSFLQEARHAFGLERVLEASNTLNVYAQSCCLGELRELTPAAPDNPEDEYFRIVESKTASQLAAAVTLPAILGGKTSEDIEALRRYGLNVGIAFQIQDDVTDIEEDAELLQQAGGAAHVKDRRLLPVLYLERYGSAMVIEHYRQTLHAGAWRPGQLAALLREQGIFDRIQRTQAHYVSAALQALNDVYPSDKLAHLRALASYVVEHHGRFHPRPDRDA